MNPLFDEISKDIAGAELLADWLGSGGRPVPRELAITRSFICQLCPHNRPEKLWETVKHMAASWIRRELEVKEKLSLELPNESKLGMCAACLCCNRLKVWTPIEHIKNHLLPSVSAQLDNACWIHSEIKAL